MKNVFFLFLAAFFITASVNAQSTADSISAKYKLQPMPGALTPERAFPVIGTYQLNSTTGGAGNVIISLDSANKGMVWVEGLPQGKFKAYLKKSPSVYRIMPQQTADGKNIPEGTLIFDPSTNVLNIALGKAFDETDPASVFALNTALATDATAGTEVKVKTKTKNSKTKEKVVFYTAAKADVNTGSTGSIQQ